VRLISLAISSGWARYAIAVAMIAIVVPETRPGRGVV